MCRLLGYCSRGRASAASLLTEQGLRDFTALSAFHGDGWGMAWYRVGVVTGLTGVISCPGTTARWPVAYRGIRTPARAQSSRRRARGMVAMPVWPMSLTAVRASAAMRGAVTWSAMSRRVGISGTPRLRERLPSSCWQASTLESVWYAGVGVGSAGAGLTRCIGGGRGVPLQPMASVVAATASSAFRYPSPIATSS